MLLCVVMYCSVLQCIACIAMYCNVLQCAAVCCNVLQCVAMYCNVLQCVAVCCNVLQCVAVCILSAHPNNGCIFFLFPTSSVSSGKAGTCLHHEWRCVLEKEREKETFLHELYLTVEWAGV